MCELTPPCSQKEPGCGIHATWGPLFSRALYCFGTWLTCNLARIPGKHKHFVPCCRLWHRLASLPPSHLPFSNPALNSARPSDPYRRLFFIPSLPNDRERERDRHADDGDGDQSEQGSQLSVSRVYLPLTAFFFFRKRRRSKSLFPLRSFRHPTSEHHFEDHPNAAQRAARGGKMLGIVGIRDWTGKSPKQKVFHLK